MAEKKIKSEELFRVSRNKWHLPPTTTINGFQVRPGIYQTNGAMLINEGVNFTVHSLGATTCTLLLYHRQ